MPIVLVHGVRVRDAAFWPEIDRYLARFIAPEIATDPGNVGIFRAFWGDIAASPAWGGISRPRSPLLGMGAAAPATGLEQATLGVTMHDALRNLPVQRAPPPSTGGLIPAGTGSGSPPLAPTFRLRDLNPDQLSDLLVTTIHATSIAARATPHTALAADAVAHDPATFPQLAACRTTEEEIALLEQRVAARIATERDPASPLISQGAPHWLQDFHERLGEAASRANDVPGYVTSRVVAELRKPLNDHVTQFVGDVFAYLHAQGTAAEPGRIPARVLATLVQARENQKARGGEPLIVLSHSMGGQIVYDLVTTFLPNLAAYADIRVDFWCATASQVGLFEELKLFLASTDSYSSAAHSVVPFPNRNHLGGWWNVWDHNDFISYTARGIIAGVDDGPYDSGMSLVHAHGGYLERPSFYRALAAKIAACKRLRWGRP